MSKTLDEIEMLQCAVIAFSKQLRPLDEYGYPTDEERSEADAILKSINLYLINGDLDDESIDESFISWFDGEDRFTLSHYIEKDREWMTGQG